MTRHRAGAALRSLLLALPLMVGACAHHDQNSPTAGASQSDQNNDPWENVNRKIWSADMALDHYLLRPIAWGYREATPDIVQTGIVNVLRNIKTPTIMANDLLQGNFHNLGQSTKRLLLNTLLGLGGFIDVAGQQKIPYHDADFGQTLGSWGVESGPYLVLPLLGPSDPRDAIGYGVDSVVDPFTIEMRAHDYEEGVYIVAGMTIISERAATIDELDELERSSLDYYAAVRSLYQQHRAGEVNKAIGGGTLPPTSVLDQDEPLIPSPSSPSTPASSDMPTPSSPPGSAPAGSAGAPGKAP